jgi:intein-encoded DNA endonuclease-like protein
MKRAEKNIAISLRQQGFSYSEILDRLTEEGHKVSKGSLSNWLKNVQLTSEQKERLIQKERRGKELGRKKIIEMRASVDETGL